MSLDIDKLVEKCKEIAPGELAGPCPECGGALRLRIWPEKGEYGCISCAIKGSFGKPRATSSQIDLTEVIVHIKTARDGRTIYITDDPGEYARLVTEGNIVFDSREMALIKQTGATPEQAASFLNIKEVFPGNRIDKIMEVNQKL